MAFKPPEALLRPLFYMQRSQIYNNYRLTLRKCSQNLIKTVICNDFAAPLSIEYQKFDQNLEENQVCIDVHYAAINFADVLLCKGKYQSSIKPPFSPGIELSGTIRKIGSQQVAQQYNLHEGDKVVSVATDSLGGYAERCITSAENVWKVPVNMPLDVAAAIPTAYGTALLALQRRARIKAGDMILITAAAGSVGLAALDIAKFSGARVIGACGSSEKCSLVLNRGAEFAINYQEENIKDKIKEATNGKGVDIVVDCVSGKLLPDLIKSLSPEGRLVVIGFSSGSIGEIRSNMLLLKNCDMIGVWWGQYNEYGGEYRRVYKQTVADAVDLCAKQKLNPHIGSVFTIDEINEAMQFILDRKSTGKVLVRVASEKGH